MSLYWRILFFFSLLGCSHFNTLEKENETAIFKKRLEEIKKNGIELYPEIKPCANLTDKACFQKQLNLVLKQNLEKNDSITLSRTQDTTWLYITIDRKGNIILKKTGETEEKTVIETIEKVLNDLSPIKPATINGLPVNCNFKIPLILKKETVIE